MVKLTCNKCKRTENIEERLLDKEVKELKIDLQDYLRLYRCPKCRPGGPSEPFDWSTISYTINIKKDIDLIEKYKDKLLWNCISVRKDLSEDFIERFRDYVNWYYISMFQKLSEKFIDRHADKVDWELIPIKQKLTDKFVEKHKDRLDWNIISRYKKLSKKFILKYIDKITDLIFYNPIYKKLPNTIKLLLEAKFGKAKEEEVQK